MTRILYFFIRYEINYNNVIPYKIHNLFPILCKWAHVYKSYLYAV